MTLKSKIISRLNTIEDENVLKAINDWLEAFVATENKDVFEISEINAITEGYEQYLTGKTIPHKEASERFNQWLAKKGK